MIFLSRQAIDDPMKSFDLSGVEDFLVKNHVYDAKTFYEAARKSSDDINLIVKNSELDADDVADVKSYLFEEKHLMPDGTYRRFDASD